MARRDNIIAINTPLRSRTNKSGKQRYTINVQAEPIVHDLDPERLGKGVAEAIAAALRRKVEGIAELAPESTQKAREAGARAFAEGKRWALKRYAGGRIGPMQPNQSKRAFNDSGRFARSIFARFNKSEGAYTINVAANRLDDATSGGAVRIWRRLVTLVPEFGNAALLLADQGVRDALEQAKDDMLRKATDRTAALKAQLRQAGLDLLKGVTGF